jgi:hypothetical protein
MTGTILPGFLVQELGYLVEVHPDLPLGRGRAEWPLVGNCRLHRQKMSQHPQYRPGMLELTAP